ncbi:hypothetical protein [Lysobacter enzymogenes]|uniref:hypothetical protein n=1 Tax=Lysobacter enzymogenes TaxID=69 RepID=UPI001440EAC6|nr:hypothetical protein [Lysobacter enzymogenes]
MKTNRNVEINANFYLRISWAYKRREKCARSTSRKCRGGTSSRVPNAALRLRRAMRRAHARTFVRIARRRSRRSRRSRTARCVQARYFEVL